MFSIIFFHIQSLHLNIHDSCDVRCIQSKLFFFFQRQRAYKITQQLRHGMGSLRHTFQLRLVVGHSHCRLCSCCLFDIYKLRSWEEPEPHCIHHILLRSRLFLSARSDRYILLFYLLSFYTITRNVQKKLISLFHYVQIYYPNFPRHSFLFILAHVFLTPVNLTV